MIRRAEVNGIVLDESNFVCSNVTFFICYKININMPEFSVPIAGLLVRHIDDQQANDS